MNLQQAYDFNDDVALYVLEYAGPDCDLDCMTELVIEAEPIFATDVRICKESFKFKKVGFGYTTEVTQIATIYLRNFSWRIHKMNVLCNQVRGKDKYENSLDEGKAAELTAYAMENALRALYESYETVWSEQEMINQFKLQLNSKFWT